MKSALDANLYYYNLAVFNDNIKPHEGYTAETNKSQINTCTFSGDNCQESDPVEKVMEWNTWELDLTETEVIWTLNGVEVIRRTDSGR